MKTVKTYILLNGNMFSYPFHVGDAIKRAYFKGSTPYNERLCGTFQTDDEALQAAMEESPMFHTVYNLWITSATAAAPVVPPEAPVVPPEATTTPIVPPETIATPEAPALTPISVANWAEAKAYMVDSYGLSKLTRNDPDSLAEKAAAYGIRFVISS